MYLRGLSSVGCNRYNYSVNAPKGPPDVIFDLTIPRDRLANEFLAFRGNRYSDGFKTQFIIHMYCCLFL